MVAWESQLLGESWEGGRQTVRLQGTGAGRARSRQEGCWSQRCCGRVGVALGALQAVVGVLQYYYGTKKSERLGVWPTYF